MTLDWKKTSKWWYGRFTINGRVKLINLNVQIKGKRPKSISGDGNEAFRISRALAYAEHDRVKKELSDNRNCKHLLSKLIDLKLGGPQRCVELKDLPYLWASLTREVTISDKYKQQGTNTLQRFVDFISKNNPDTLELVQVSKEQVKAFMDAEEERGISVRTWNYTRSLLKGSFEKLEPLSRAYTEYLETCPCKKDDTINREPFKIDELRSIIDASENDDFIRPIILMGAYTALRRGDCCLLKWCDVDLSDDFITVKTHKTGKDIEIAILPELKKEILTHRGNGSKYVFPEQAEMYINNPDGITWRLTRLFETIDFYDAACCDQKNSALRRKRDKGILSASVRNFHSLRVTGATNMLAAGIPPEEVIKITGHQTVDILMKHYDQRTKEQRRACTRRYMQNMSPTASKTREQKLREILLKMNPKKLREEALRILDGTD